MKTHLYSFCVFFFLFVAKRQRPDSLCPKTRRHVASPFFYKCAYDSKEVRRHCPHPIRAFAGVGISEYLAPLLITFPVPYRGAHLTHKLSMTIAHKWFITEGDSTLIRRQGSLAKTWIWGSGFGTSAHRTGIDAQFGRRVVGEREGLEGDRRDEKNTTEQEMKKEHVVGCV